MNTAFIFVFVVMALSILIFLFLLHSLTKKSAGKGTPPKSTGDIDESNYDTLELKLFKLKTEVWGDTAEAHTHEKNNFSPGNNEPREKYRTISFIPGQLGTGEDLNVTKSRSGVCY